MVPYLRICHNHTLLKFFNIYITKHVVNRNPFLHRNTLETCSIKYSKMLYYIPITDTTLELSVIWQSDRESRTNELMFSESISLSFKTRLTSVTCFSATLRKVNCEHGTRDGKHVDVTSRNVTLWQTFPLFFGIKDQNRF